MFRHAFAAGMLLLAATPGLAAASPGSMMVVTAPGAGSDVIEVSGGCGPYGHRGPYGACRPNVIPRLVCPYGFHLGPYGHRCFPN